MDIEGLVLSRLLEPNIMAQCWDLGLREEVFEDPQNNAIFQFIQDYWLEERMETAPTVDIIQHEFPGWHPVHNDEESITWLVGALKKRLAANKAQEVMRQAAQLSVDDPQEALNILFDGSWEAKKSLLERANRSDLSQNVEERRRRYTEQLELGDGVPIGLDEVDDHTRGILPGELVAVAASTKTGKSFLLVKAALEARRAGFTPYVATLEMSVPEMEERFDALNSGVGYGRLQRRELNFEEQKRLTESQDRLADMGPVYIEQPDRGERTVQYITNRARQLGCDFLVIDQLSFMESRRFYQSTTDKHAEIIHELKEDVANTANGKLPTMLAVQLNRAASSENASTRGTMQNIANSSAIEQTVDLAYGLYRNKEIRANDCMVLDILGSRRTDPKSWLLNWKLDTISQFSVIKEYED